MMEDHLKIVLLEDSEHTETIWRFLQKANPHWQFRAATKMNSYLQLLDKFNAK